MQISEAEWKVMQTLWSNGSMSLGEIIKELAAENQWNGNTVRTLVVRLVEKGAVSADKQGRNYVYSAIAGESDCVLKETEHFLCRIFDGSPSKLFAALSSGGKLTNQDISEIEEMIHMLRERDLNA